MKINSIPNYNLNFRKTLLGYTNVKTARGELQEVDFVEYDPNNEKDILQISKLKSKWGRQAKYIKEIISEFLNINSTGSYRTDENAYFYGLEDKKGKTLAIAEVLEDNPGANTCCASEYNYSYINYMQADPKEQFGVKCRQYKGLGENLVSEIVKLASAKSRAVVQLTSENDNFWDNSKFFTTCDFGVEGCKEKYLLAENFNNYINYVENKKAKLNVCV